VDDTLVQYDVERCTTEKLEGVLNDIADDGHEVYLTQYVGGRDWVVISSRRVRGSVAVSTVRA